MNKQAVSAIFAWIFIMVVGGLIIGLFFTIANNQAQAGEDRLAQNALQQVNTILNTQASSFDTSTTVRIPARRITLSCEAFRQSTSSVTLRSQLEIGGFSRITQEDLLVGRDIQSDQLILFSKEWRAPFRVGNILHVSSAEELLVVSGDEHPYTLPSSWEGVIPDVVNVQNYTNVPIDALRYQNVRVVVFSEDEFNSDASDLLDDILQPGGEGQQTHYMHVQYNNDVREAGNVTYWDGANQAGPYPYVGEGMLTGLLWQASPPEANCLQHKLAEDLKRQTTLQQARREALQTHYDDNSNLACSGDLTNQYLNRLGSAPGISQAGNPLYKFEDFKEDADAVRNQNERLLRGERCATIY